MTILPPHDTNTSQDKQIALHSNNQDVAKLLLDSGLVPASLLQEYLAQCQQNKQNLGQSLVRDGHLTIQQLAKVMALVKTRTRAAGTTEKASEPVGWPASQQGLVGEHLGEHEIMTELGRGGMGVVYKARHLPSGRIVALKVLLGGSQADSGQVKRFLREANAIASLNHTNIVAIYTIAQDKGYQYFTMPYLSGGSFERQLKDADMPLATKLEMLVKICLALAHAHDKKIVHRDLKPSNILLDQGGEPFLTDFGLAKNLDSDSRLTQTGNVVGTPYYMSPEQVKTSKQLDHRSDIYSLGVILYQLLTDRLPFLADTPIELYSKIAEQEPVHPSSINAQVSPPLAAICLKAMEKTPAFRYASAGEMAADLQNFLHGKKVAAARLDVQRVLSGVYRRCRLRILLAGLLFMVPLLAWAAFEYKASRNKPAATAPEALIDQYYEDGLGKLKEQSPQEASIHFHKALHSLLAQKKNAGPERAGQLADLEKRIYLAIVEAAYQATDYQQVMRVGEMLPEKFSLPAAAARKLHWQVALSTYHCQLYERATDLFARLEQELAALDKTGERLADEDHMIYAGSIYYQGRVLFAADSHKSAKPQLERAIAVYQSRPSRYDFAPAMYLCFCASLLVDFEYMLTPQELSLVDGYLQRMETENLADMADLYRQTKARYLLQLAQNAQGEQRERTAREILSLLDGYLQRRSPPASLYYMRAKAYQLLREYIKAKNDFATALQREPANLTCVRAQLELLADYAEPADFHNYYLEFHRDSEKSLWVKVDLFAKEFARLKNHYVLQYHSLAKGMSFSDQKFSEFCRLLEDEPLRSIGEAALCSMLPSEKTLAALENRIQQATTVAGKQALQHLIGDVRAADSRRRLASLLASLSQVAGEDKIWDIDQFHDPEQLELLQKVLADDKHNLLVRFQAARILARVPSLAVRMPLIQQYQQCDLALQIIVARALQEAEIVHRLWNKDFFKQLVVHFTPPQAGLPLPSMLPDSDIVTTAQQQEFLYFLLAEMVPTYDPDIIPIAQWLLENGSQRVKLAVFSRCNQVPPQILTQAVEVCKQGLLSPQPDLQTYTLAVLGRHVNAPIDMIQSHWRSIVREKMWNEALHKHICDLAQQDNLANQKAILYLWRGLLRVIKQSPRVRQDIVKIVRQMWRSQASVVRCQALISSAKMDDEKMLSNLLENKSDFSVSEQITGFVVSLKTQYRQNKHQFVKFIQLCMNTVKDPEVSPLLRGIMLYLCTMYINTTGREQTPIQPILLIPLVEGPLLDGLRGESPILRFAAVLAVGNMPKVSAKMLATLSQLKDQDTHLHIRAAASGILLVHYMNQRAPEYEAQKDMIKQQQGENGRMYKMSALWGYTTALANSYMMSYKISSQIGDPEKMWAYRCEQIAQYLYVNPGDLQEYLRRLEAVLELHLDDEIVLASQDLFYLLAWFYHLDGKREKALDLTTQIIDRLGRKDIRMPELWTKLMIETNRTAQARSRLEEMLKQSARQLPGEDLARLALHQAALYRSLALVCQAEKGRSEEIEALLQKQYLLAPRQTISLRAMVDHYYGRAEYARLIPLCQEATLYLPNDGESAIWMAKAYAKLGDFANGMRSLNIVGDLGYFHLPRHLQMHPEFAVWANTQEYKKLLGNHFSTERQKND